MKDGSDHSLAISTAKKLDWQYRSAAAIHPRCSVFGGITHPVTFVIDAWRLNEVDRDGPLVLYEPLLKAKALVSA
jgi:hypothetical protein